MSVGHVNALLEQFDETRKMMNRLAGGKMRITSYQGGGPLSGGDLKAG